MSADRKLHVSLLTIFLLITAACGTTVPVEQQELAEVAAATGEDLGGALPEGATINEKGQVVSESGEILGDAEDFGIDPGSGSTVTPGNGDTDGVAAAADPVDPGENGPGVSSTTIKIGISYADDTEEANAALGAAEGVGQINQRQAWEAMIKYINEHGGAAGRELEPVFHKLSAGSTEPYDQQDQETCAHWTQDDPVFVADGAFKTENGIACFQKNGMVTITTNGLRFKSGDFFERYPTYLEFDGVDNDAIDIMYADNMKKLGFFNGDYRLGILSWSDPEYANPTKNTLVPRLQKLGIEVSDVTYIPVAESGGEAAGPIAQIGNTAVRYKNDGITHIMAQDLGGNLAIFFMAAADRQQYFPRYGLTTASGNTTMANALKGLASEDTARRQLEDAVSIGFMPTVDANAEDIPSWGQSTARDICYKQMREGGVEMADSNAQALAGGVCDAAWTIQATLNAIPGEVINQQTWYEALGRVRQMNVELTGGTALNVSPTRRDALELAARMKYVDGCVCFRYVSGPFQIPE